MAESFAATPPLAAGSEVRLVNDPYRIGTVTAEPPRDRTSGREWHVRFASKRIWVPETQLEPIPEIPSSPSGSLRAGELGSVAEFRRALLHLRISGHLSDTLYSMEATNTEFLAYQFLPVLRLLESPTRRLLIADEVGLGKTIEAGLIWTELRARFDARRLVVICPRALQAKWLRELRLRFGVEASLCDDARTLLDALERPTRTESALIVRMSSLSRWRRPPEDRPRGVRRDWEDPDNQLPGARLARFLNEHKHTELMDLLVVDEAHHCRSLHALVHESVRLATDTAAHAVFLSATPVHNRQRDLYALLHLLVPDLFSTPEILDDIVELNRPIIEARDLLLGPETTLGQVAERLDQDSSSKQLPVSERIRRLAAARGDSSLEPDDRAVLAEELDRTNLLGNLITRTRKRLVEGNRVTREPIPQSVSMDRSERDYYDFVTGAVNRYASMSEGGKGFLLAVPQRLMASCLPASLDVWFARGEGQLDLSDGLAFDADTGTDQGDDARPLVAAIRDELLGRFSSTSGLRAELASRDSKYALLLGKLREYLEFYPDEKLVVFSSFRATVDYLGQRLEKDGISTLVLKGGQDQTVDDALLRFEDPAGPSVLLSTEIGGEGVDLQFCRLLVNYDLPWNPMRVEQRIGRLDRIGQRADKITIWTLLHEDTIDFRIHEVLYEKLDLFRRALGDFEPIVGDHLRTLEQELIGSELTAEQQTNQINQTTLALRNVRRQEERLEEEASGLLAHRETILRRIHQAKDRKRWISGDDVRGYVMDYLKGHYPGTDLRAVNGRQNSEAPIYDLRLPESAKRDLEEFLRDSPSTAPTLLTRPGDFPVRCQFENRLGTAHLGGIEAISQFHPVTRFVGARLNQQANEGHLYPAVALRVRQELLSGVQPPGTYVLAVKGQALEGVRRETQLRYGSKALADDRRLSEADAEQLAGVCVRFGTAWHGWRAERLDLETAADIADELFGELSEQLVGIQTRAETANRGRVEEQLRAIDRRIESESRRYEDRIGSHRRYGRDNLARAEEVRREAALGRLRRQRKRVASHDYLRASPPEDIALAIVLVTAESDSNPSADCAR